MADDLRTRALTLSELQKSCGWTDHARHRLLDELLAEVDRLTAEQDEWEDRAGAAAYGIIKRDAEIDRLRNLAVALEAEVARADERVAELESRAAYVATT